jgi:hypothetical protein
LTNACRASTPPSRIAITPEGRNEQQENILVGHAHSITNTDLTRIYPKSNHKLFDFFAGISHIKFVEFGLRSWKYDLLGFAALEKLVMLSNLVLFSYGGPDLMMAGGAVIAVICGVVLMGGRSVAGLLLRMVTNLRHRRLERPRVVGAGIPIADHGYEQDAHGPHRPIRHVA